MTCTPIGNPCSVVEIKYKGNGTQVLFTFPFTYIDPCDVHVSLWDNDTKQYEELDRDKWSFDNATTIRFESAPPVPPTADPNIDGEEIFNIKIWRWTDIDPLSATFYPGSAIRAQDLNDNFEQLKLAIEENRCQVPDWLLDYINDYYWNKYDETIYCSDDWIADDEHIASTCAIDKHFWNNNEDTVKEPDQLEGRWVDGNLNDDEHIATTKAISTRLDSYLQDNKPQEPSAGQIRHPGKRWYDTNSIADYLWNEDIRAWVHERDYVTQGPQGNAGPPGIGIYTGDRPPYELTIPGSTETRPIQDGDAWFDTGSGNLYVYYCPDPSGSCQWVSVGRPGPQGEKGDKGDPGTDGEMTLANLLSEAPIKIDKDTTLKQANFTIDLSILNPI